MASLRSRLLRRCLLTPPRISSTPRISKRSLIPAPAPDSGPLLTRRSDRELPSVASITSVWRIWKHLPIVLAIIGASAVGIFNYQKTNHSVVNSSLYALRMNPLARELLGDEVYFRDRIPWIAGKIDSLHGEVDVAFGVKGTVGKGVMRFRCVRPKRQRFFNTEIWTLTMEDGTEYDLLKAAGSDPMENTASFA